MAIFTPQARYFCPSSPRGEVRDWTLVMLLSPMSSLPSADRRRRPLRLASPDVVDATNWRSGDGGRGRDLRLWRAPPDPRQRRPARRVSAHPGDGGGHDGGGRG